MRQVLNVYLVKIKAVLGAVRASRINLLLIYLYLFGASIGSFGLGTGLGQSLRFINPVSFIDETSALISAFLAIAITLSFRGFTVFDYEESLFFTSTITPRAFIAATMLSDLTVFSIFLIPLFLTLWVFTTTLALPLTTSLSLLATATLLLASMVFIKQSLSILISIRKEPMLRFTLVFIIALLLLPAASFIDPCFPLRYKSLPYPSTFAAEVLLHILSQEAPPTISLLGFSLYLAFSTTLLIICSGRDVFRYARPIPFYSAFDTSMRTQTIKMKRSIRAFSKMGMKFTLDLKPSPISHFLIRKELIRMVRDGSLFFVTFLYVIVLIIGLASEKSPSAWILILAVYSLLIPTMLTVNWRIGEIDCLWTLLTSPLNLKIFFSSLLYAFIAVSTFIPAVTILILGILTRSNIVMPLFLAASASMIGSSANLFVMIHFLERRRRATSGVIVAWLSFLLSGILLAPAYAGIGLSLIFETSFFTDLLFGALILLYSYVIFRFLLERIEHKALNIEI